MQFTGLLSCTTLFSIAIAIPLSEAAGSVSTLGKRTNVGVKLCTADGFTGYCQYIDQPVNECVALSSDLDKLVSAVAPDKDAGDCRFYLSDSEQQDLNACNPCRLAKLKCTYHDQPAPRGRPQKQQNPASQHRAESTSFIRHMEDKFDTHPTTSPAEDETVPDAILPHPGHDFINHTGVYPPENWMLHLQATRSNYDIWSSIEEFFDTTYVIFPILSYFDVASRLIIEPDWASVPDLRTLLLAIRLLNTAAQYRMDLQDKDNLCDLTRQVEASRLWHDFADPATLDAVFCSLCLFVSYNVLEKHPRSFLYLDEAVGLFEAVVPLGKDEEQRRLRTEQVLYNTESATHAAYATTDRQRRARKPSMDSNDNPAVQHGLGRDMEFDKVAIHLLRRLTQIHLAEDAGGLEQIGVESDIDMAKLFGAILDHNRYSRIQAADVIITRQWQLSSKLVAICSGRSAIERLSQSSAEHLGIVAMSWICLLKEGELRIVGLAKLAGLALNICALADLTKCLDIVRGLTGALMREDHERRFALPLANIFTAMASSVPPFIGPKGGEQVWHDTTKIYTTTPTESTTIEPTGPDVRGWETESESRAQPYAQLAGVEQTNYLEAGDIDWLVELA
ncbi:hypothetical protein B7494_g3010 [Chlorociboria aeruginascens]|nr:hypothetical protein B7494_g3010 [Chlorociboria aeruginascens]